MQNFDLDIFRKEFDFSLFINEHNLHERNTKVPFMIHFQNNIVTQSGYKLAENYAKLLLAVNLDSNFLSQEEIKCAQHNGLRIFFIDDFINIYSMFLNTPKANKKDREAFNKYKALRNNVCQQNKILNYLLKIYPSFLTEEQRKKLTDMGLDLPNSVAEIKI